MRTNLISNLQNANAIFNTCLKTKRNIQFSFHYFECYRFDLMSIDKLPRTLLQDALFLMAFLYFPFEIQRRDNNVLKMYLLFFVSFSLSLVLTL